MVRTYLNHSPPPPNTHTPTHSNKQQELVLKRIRDGRVGLPTHGMNAHELRALIDEQPHEAERIIKRDKRSSYFRYLKEFLGMAVDDAVPASGPGATAAGGAAITAASASGRSSGMKRPAPSSSFASTTSQPSSVSASASATTFSSSSSSSSLSRAPSLASNNKDARALLLLEEEEGRGGGGVGGGGSGHGGPVVCWSPAVRGEYLAWLQEPAARGGWGLVGGAEEAVNYVRTGHVLVRKVLADALGRADYKVRAWVI
jgi:hypothetical protein